MCRRNSCDAKAGFRTVWSFSRALRQQPTQNSSTLEHPRLCRPVVPRLCRRVVFRLCVENEIPKELDDLLEVLGSLEEFSCGENPWVEPPAAVLGESGNVPAVRSYFVDLYREKRVISRSLKVVLVGREGTGKTRCSQELEILVHSSLYDLA